MPEPWPQASSRPSGGGGFLDSRSLLATAAAEKGQEVGWLLSPSRSAMSSEPPPPAQPPAQQASGGLLDTPRARERSPSPLRGNVVPSPLPTRRTRTFSATVRASQGPIYRGVCKCFCRSKGHGFITPADGGPDIFLHISDVEGEYVPMEGDEVTYKMCSIPPKNEKLQAVEVVITHLAPGTKHETWSGHVISS
ncbi:calcium-regulated heat-stable protein 1 isoform X1 [Carlito syrichta]|uniref:Calcium-regulated heat-stable protein 1 isoform X1 n=2 Tax=Carlito syrichta TaxID=1868482 RepID=A0A3Q0E1E6_CARSF|nr:calcium-regulated heat-stable protein 1 isoform X1 [Carlito syrichta]